FFVLPGMVWSVAMSFFLFLIIVEERGVYDSFRESFFLVRKDWRDVLSMLGMLLACYCLVLLPLLFGLAFWGASGGLIAMVALVVAAILLPLGVASYLELFRLLRLRTKGQVRIVTSVTGGHQA
ncbi:MAG: hypothetical protein GX606_00540, partial [Elusimicrobia bacterium]|nr:hypothetical protein [Elusimicrobiota bacterium]